MINKYKLIGEDPVGIIIVKQFNQKFKMIKMYKGQVLLIVLGQVMNGHNKDGIHLRNPWKVMIIRKKVHKDQN